MAPLTRFNLYDYSITTLSLRAGHLSMTKELIVWRAHEGRHAVPLEVIAKGLCFDAAQHDKI